MSRFNADSVASTRCYIINNSTNEKLVFQFNPTSVPYSRTANFVTIDSPGMSYPLTQYTGGKVRDFKIDLFYYDNPYTGKIKKAREFLEKLLPPENNTVSFVPPTFTFAYGYFVKTLVLTQLDVTDDRLDSNGNPITTYFSLSVRQVGA